MKRFFPHLMPYASIALVQSGDHILNSFDEKISECTFLSSATEACRLEFSLSDQFRYGEKVLSRRNPSVDKHESEGSERKGSDCDGHQDQKSLSSSVRCLRVEYWNHTDSPRQLFDSEYPRTNASTCSADRFAPARKGNQEHFRYWRLLFY